MERREFCRFLCACGIVGCSGALAGCARLLRWSEARHDIATDRRLRSVTASPSSLPTSTEETAGPTSGTTPDLAVARGGDPAANTRLAISMLGGMGRFVKRGANVVVKPNVLTAREPRYGATTHPDAVGAVIELCWEAGAASVTILDRPTAPPRQAYEVSGIKAVARRFDARLKVLTDRDYERIAIPDGRLLTSWPFVVDVFEADTFINMPCAKSHGLAVVTLSMKNLMGVMGGVRGTVHQDFPHKIVDVSTLIRPHLIVLDAYRVLFRNGPTGGGLGDVRLARTCVAGTDPVAVDAYGATLVGFQPDEVPHIVAAAERGLGEARLDRVRIEERRA